MMACVELPLPAFTIRLLRRCQCTSLKRRERMRSRVFWFAALMFCHRFCAGNPLMSFRDAWRQRKQEFLLEAKVRPLRASPVAAVSPESRLATSAVSPVLGLFQRLSLAGSADLD
jgi:hypothetical protein